MLTDAETSRSARALKRPRLKLPANPMATKFMRVLTCHSFVVLKLLQLKQGQRNGLALQPGRPQQVRHVAFRNRGGLWPIPACILHGQDRSPLQFAVFSSILDECETSRLHRGWPAARICLTRAGRS